MIIEISKLSSEGANLYEGEDPGEVLDLQDDRFVHAGGAVSYRLEAQIVSHELVVRGSTGTEVSLLCCRCGGFFSTRIEVSSFLRAYPISEGAETVDVTPDLREEILLALPSFPACEWKGEQGVCPHSGVDVGELKRSQELADDNRWDALNGLGE